MDELDKMLLDCEKRMKNTADLIKENFRDNEGIDKLYEAAKELDNIKIKAKKENAALDQCKIVISQAADPSYINVKEIFNEAMKKETKEKSKNKKNQIYNALKKHVEEDSGDFVMEAESQTPQALDPWTKMPVQHPIQSSTCKHIYDKKSINCIIKNRPQFRCPHMGCQSVISSKDLIDLMENDS